MDKVVYIKAYFCPIGKEVNIKVSTGEKKKGLFGGEKDIKKNVKEWKQTGWSDTEIDGERLSEDLKNSIELLNNEGYLVKTVTPVISGAYNYRAQEVSSSARVFGDTEAVRGGASFGYGYSYTDSLIVIATKNA